jgi:hypothetical protein
MGIPINEETVISEATKAERQPETVKTLASIIKGMFAIETIF